MSNAKAKYFYLVPAVIAWKSLGVNPREMADEYGRFFCPVFHNKSAAMDAYPELEEDQLLKVARMDLNE